MTVCIGLIPNKQTSMLMQDSEVTYSGVALHQDIASKVHKVSENAVVGIIGDPHPALEMLELLEENPVTNPRDLCTRLEDVYHTVRGRKFDLGILRKHGFSNIREVLSPQVDSDFRKTILAALDNRDAFVVNLMLAYHFGSPGLYHINYPGIGSLENQVKMYQVDGSGSLSAADIVGNALTRYRWQPELTLSEAVLTMIDAGIASEKHTGVQRPFRISYVSREVPEHETEPQSVVCGLDTKMLNMIIHAQPYARQENVLQDAVARLLKATKGQATQEETVELADYLKSKIKLGVEFDEYFGIA